MIRALLALALLPAAFAQRPGVLPKHWITGGPNCMEVPDWQVHEYNPDFYIIRESGCTNYEKPFLYLLFGKDRALLEDTGAGKADTARIVQDVIGKWLRRNGRTSIPLVVAHSHAHGDHVSGDRQLAMLPNVEMVPLDPAGTAKYYRIADWPHGSGSIDLGDRVIDVIPIPGHEKSSVALYDRQTGVLLTGDTLYPGRLYIPAADFATFTESVQRLVDFTAGKTVTHVLGTHVEQSSTPFVDYPIGSFYQPHEHTLELGRAHLLELNQALQAMHGNPARLLLRDFTIWPITPEVRKEMEATRKATEERLRPNMWGQPGKL